MVPVDELEPASPPRRGRRLILTGAAVALVAGALLFGLRPAAPERVAPSFTLPRLDGKGTISSSQLRGRPLVVNFFASWCVPCREEAPLLERIWNRYKSRGIRFLGVNVTDTRSSAQGFLRRYGITYPVVTDYPLTYAQKMKVYGLPITYFIDRNGHFLAASAGHKVGAQRSGMTVLGAISEEELQKGVEELLAR